MEESGMTQGKEHNITSEIGYEILRSDFNPIFVAGLVDSIKSLQEEYIIKEMEASQHQMKETRGQVDSVEEDGPGVVDNRQLFVGKDIDKLKMFEGAGGQSEQARRQVMEAVVIHYSQDILLNSKN
jgi:hypothetical protein